MVGAEDVGAGKEGKNTIGENRSKKTLGERKESGEG
jgi:hypothetical protein